MARNTPKTDDTPDTPDTADEMREGEHNPFVNSLLHVARRLDDERDALMVKVNANRESLRGMRKQNLLSEEQASAIEEFYPTRVRKPKDTAPAAVSAVTPDAPNVAPVNTPAAA